MEISKVYRRFIPQLLHMIVLPLFFFSFILIYRPFDAESLIGSEWFGVHLTILSCIILVSTIVTRLLYYFIPMRLNYVLYVFWCFAVISRAIFARNRHHILKYLLLRLKWPSLPLSFPMPYLPCLSGFMNTILSPAIRMTIQMQE